MGDVNLFAVFRWRSFGLVFVDITLRASNKMDNECNCAVKLLAMRRWVRTTMKWRQWRVSARMLTAVTSVWWTLMSWESRVTAAARLTTVMTRHDDRPGRTFCDVASVEHDRQRRVSTVHHLLARRATLMIHDCQILVSLLPGIQRNNNNITKN